LVSEESPLAKRARVLATDAHAGQTDKAGIEYIRHPEGVARRVADAGYDERYIAVAWMHDVIEDCGITPASLTEQGFPGDVVAGVVAMTKQDGDADADAVERAASNELALVCKAADVADNTDPARQALLATIDPDKLSDLTKKYALYRKVLDNHGAPTL
jgi:(p)ppGpp synthase/HD superfamily hydrolase